MLPKLCKKEHPLRKASPALIRPRSSSNKPSENRVTKKGNRNPSPMVATLKSSKLQNMFRQIDKDEENHFIQLLQELN